MVPFEIMYSDILNVTIGNINFYISPTTFSLGITTDFIMSLDKRILQTAIKVTN